MGRLSRSGSTVSIRFTVRWAFISDMSRFTEANVDHDRLKGEEPFHKDTEVEMEQVETSAPSFAYSRTPASPNFITIPHYALQLVGSARLDLGY